MAHVIIPNNRPATFTTGGTSANHIWSLCNAMLKAGWRYVGSAASGSKDTSFDPRNNRFLQMAVSGCNGLTGSCATGMSGTAASIGTKTGYDVSVTNLTGMVAPLLNNKGGSEGNYLVFGNTASPGNGTIMQISQVISPTQVMCRPLLTASSAVASDGNNGSITWAEYDPTIATYPSGGNFTNTQYWMALSGFQVLKLTFTGTLGTFIRGEKLTQPGTSAEGELLGITYDPAGGGGWATVQPRVAGTDPGLPHGWLTGSAITGSWSGAVFTPLTSLEYVNEIVISGCGTSATSRAQGMGSIWITHAALDGLTGVEQPQLPSLLMTSSGCTSTIHPGGGGTSNTFPALGFSPIGQSGTATSTTWFQMVTTDQNTVYPGIGQIMVTNGISRAGRSGDYTFTLAFSSPSTGPYTYNGFSYQRLDDTEEGELYPFAFFAPWFNLLDYNGIFTATSYRGGLSSTSQAGNEGVNFAPYTIMSLNRGDRGPYWWTWRARGLERGGGNTDKFTACIAHAICFGSSQAWGYGMGSNTNDSEKVASAAVPTMVREPLMLANFGSNGSGALSFKVRKGRTRWCSVIQGSRANDTFGNRTWIQLRDSGVNDPNFAGIILGPWDGSTVPVAS